MTEEKNNETIEQGEEKAAEEIVNEAPETPQDEAKKEEQKAQQGTETSGGGDEKKTSEEKSGPAREERRDRRPDSYNRPQRSDRDQQSRFPRFRRKVCRFCHEETLEIDYKSREILERFITDRGKILPRRVTGTCARHQRLLARAIKKARYIALIPYVEK